MSIERSIWQRLFHGRTFSFCEVSSPGLNATAGQPGGWESASDTPWFELVPPDGRYPQGCVLLEGRLARRGTDFTARLRVDAGRGFAESPAYELPVSAKGSLLEVIRLPKGVRALRFEPMQSRGDFELTALRATELGWPARIGYMAYRVATMLMDRPGAQLRQTGLTPWLALRDLRQAYRLAGRLRHYSPNLSYVEWRRQFDVLTTADRARIRLAMSMFRTRPELHVVVLTRNGDPAPLQRTLKSLADQLYAPIRVSVLEQPDSAAGCPVLPPTLTSGAELVPADQAERFLTEINGYLATAPLDRFLAFVRAGDTLSPHALYWLAAELQGEGGAALLYTDDDAIGHDGERTAPRFKPDWSPEHLRSSNYIGTFALLRGREILAAGGVDSGDLPSDGYGLLLRVGAGLSGQSVRHVPWVLYHRAWAATEEAARQLDAAEARALADHLARQAVRAEVVQTLPGCRQVRYALPSPPPRVCIIIPTRDKPALLRRCVESVLARTTYLRYEILVVDNQSVEPEALAYLDALRSEPRVRILRYDLPFNFSAINNHAAAAAGGDVLCLLNNDTEVISTDWLETMLGQLVQEGVGAVGAKLLYPDGRVQHGGDAVGPGGCADHFHSMLAEDATGYCNRAQVAQELSAVTAACLLTWKDLYLRLDGLDEVHLKVAFNDVDYCLRVWAAGYRVIWTPHAKLYHHESATRGHDSSTDKLKRTRAEADYVRRRWPERMLHDPYYNPNLSYERPDFSLSQAPRVSKPWDKW